MFSDSHPLLLLLDSNQKPVELDRLAELLTALNISRGDVSNFCKFEETCYARNLVKRSAWYELLVLCWRSGQASPIHDHFGSSCAFKIIQGQATEVNFESTGPGKARAVNQAMYHEKDVCVSSSGHIHQISNRQQSDHDLITLHIYSPPLRMGLYRPDPIYHPADQNPVSL